MVFLESDPEYFLQMYFKCIDVLTTMQHNFLFVVVYSHEYTGISICKLIHFNVYNFGTIYSPFVKMQPNCFIATYKNTIVRYYD